jgi:hypothetical protein
MADEMESPPAGGGIGGRQKRAFLVAAVLALGVGLAIKFLGKQSAVSADAAGGTPDTAGLSAPPPVSVYNSYYTTGGAPTPPGTDPGHFSGHWPVDPILPHPGGGSGGTGTGGGGIKIHPKNPIDPPGGVRTGGGLGPGGIHPRNPIDPIPHGGPPVRAGAPLPIGSDPAHYFAAPAHPRAPVVAPAAPRKTILTPNILRATRS